MATKGARGEAFLEADGQSYPILFTNRAVVEAEQRTGKAFLHLLRQATQGELGMGDVASLLLTGLEAARRDSHASGKPYQINQAFDLIDAVGFQQAAAAVIAALTEVLTFGTTEDTGETEGPPAQ